MLDKIRAIYYPPGKDLFTFEKGFKNPWRIIPNTLPIIAYILVTKTQQQTT
jgi:hypothetical protein